MQNKQHNYACTTHNTLKDSYCAMPVYTVQVESDSNIMPAGYTPSLSSVGLSEHLLMADS